MDLCLLSVKNAMNWTSGCWYFVPPLVVIPPSLTNDLGARNAAGPTACDGPSLVLLTRTPEAMRCEFRTCPLTPAGAEFAPHPPLPSLHMSADGYHEGLWIQRLHPEQ
jgi:hypothetical protein